MHSTNIRGNLQKRTLLYYYYATFTIKSGSSFKLKISFQLHDANEWGSCVTMTTMTKVVLKHDTDYGVGTTPKFCSSLLSTLGGYTT